MTTLLCMSVHGSASLPDELDACLLLPVTSRICRPGTTQQTLSYKPLTDYGAGNLPDELDAWFLSFASAFVGALSCWLSYKYKLDASMRLFVITFLMVRGAV